MAVASEKTLTREVLALALLDDGGEDWDQTFTPGLEDLYPLMASLRSLNLGRMRLASTEEGVFHGFGKLQELNLSNNCLRSFEAVAELEHLQRLDLSNNRITELPSAIRSCSKLETLQLHGNMIADLDSFYRLRSCVALRVLTLEGNPVCREPKFEVTLLAAVTDRETGRAAASRAAERLEAEARAEASALAARTGAGAATNETATRSTRAAGQSGRAGQAEVAAAPAHASLGETAKDCQRPSLSSTCTEALTPNSSVGNGLATAANAGSVGELSVAFAGKAVVAAPRPKFLFGSWASRGQEGRKA